MTEVTGKALARLLEQHGWQLNGVNGSHHIYGKPGSTVRLSVPIHSNKPLKEGLLRFLLKAAGLSVDNL